MSSNFIPLATVAYFRKFTNSLIQLIPSIKTCIRSCNMHLQISKLFKFNSGLGYFIPSFSNSGESLIISNVIKCLLISLST
jgi:hypothetical protein